MIFLAGMGLFLAGMVWGIYMMGAFMQGPRWPLTLIMSYRRQ